MIRVQSHKSVKMTKGELKKVRSALPPGSYDKIAESLSLGIYTVRASLYYPEKVKVDVIELALKMIQEENERIKRLKTQIKKS